MKSARARFASHDVRKRQSGGFVLLDAMIAVVVFSIGIVGMVALQGSAIQMTGSANYRLNAALATDQVIAQMWGNDPTQLANLYQGASGAGGANYLSWIKSIDCSQTTAGSNCLPGVSANPPTITVASQTTNTGNTEYLVTVTLNWQAPSDSVAHSYTSVTDIGT